MRLSTFSTAPYVSPRKGKCQANGDKCNGFAINGEKFCYPHSNKKKKADEEKAKAKEASNAVAADA